MSNTAHDYHDANMPITDEITERLLGISPGGDLTLIAAFTEDLNGPQVGETKTLDGASIRQALSPEDAFRAWLSPI